jgi:16S rRNA pseudouridine516 synthase
VKLDRLLAKHRGMGRKQARGLIAAGAVSVDGVPRDQHDAEVDRFHHVVAAGETVQAGQRRLFILLHKPVGVVSATKDAGHRTVIDLIEDPDKHTLHIVGRLDRNTSGLILLTNDGNWSKPLTHPDHKVPKVYLVETAQPIPAEAVRAFEAGFYFHTEDLTTRPAKLEILSDTTARLTLHEGRYHQVKRMFHRIGNRVVALHREAIGPVPLPENLPPGCWRFLETREIEALRPENPPQSGLQADQVQKNPPPSGHKSSKFPENGDFGLARPD